MVKTIAVVGGNIGASFAIDGILKAIGHEPENQYEIKVIAPSGSLYVVSMPRALVQPNVYSQITFDLAKKYEKYGNIQFINDKVKEADLDTNQLTLESSGQAINYDYLVLATGLSYKSKLFDRSNGKIGSEKYFSEITSQIKNAKTVAIIGGGPTGVETAGEIAEKFPNANVILFTGAAGVIPAFPPSQAKKVEDHLRRLKIKLIHERVVSNIKREGHDTINLTTDRGTSETADVVITALSGAPNTSFIKSKAVVDPKGYVLQDGLRIKGYENAFVLGDIVAGANNTLVSLQMSQAPIFDKNIKTVLSGESSPLKPFKEASSLTMLVPVSSKGGVGLIFGWNVPSFLVRMIKSKDFMVSKARQIFE